MARQRNDVFLNVYVFLPIKINRSNGADYFATSCMKSLFAKICEDIVVYNNGQNRSNAASNRTDIESDPDSVGSVYRTPPLGSVLNETCTPAMPIRILTKNDFRFLCFLTMAEVLCQNRNPFPLEDLSEMCIACRNRYPDNISYLNEIDEFAKNYERARDNIIRFYTKASCFFRVINSACRTESMRCMYTFRVFISDLNNRLKALAETEQNNRLRTLLTTVFRGKVLSESALQQLIDNEGSLISMNGFLSTSDNLNVASAYHGEGGVSAGERSVLFKLDVNENITQPYAHISTESSIPDENEVLFSLGIIWRIKSIVITSELCTIELTPCNEINSERIQLSTKYIKEELGLLSLGDILYDLGDNIEADWFYHKMLEKPYLARNIKSSLYYRIGMARFKLKDYYIALENFEISANLSKTSYNELNLIELPRPVYTHNDHSPLIAIHNNRGLLYAQNGRFDSAAGCYKTALATGGSNSEIAIVHNNFGLLYFRYGDFNEAYYHHTKAIALINASHPWRAEFIRNCAHVQQYWENNAQARRDPNAQARRDPNAQARQDPNAQARQDPNAQARQDPNAQARQFPNVQARIRSICRLS